MLPPTDPPASWPVPQLPGGQPEAARAAAQAYDQLAGRARSAAGAVATVRLLCDGDQGQAAVAFRRVLDELETQHRDLARFADLAAAALRRYADRLAAAHAAHRFSLHRLLATGAVLAVTAGAMYVTLGAATPLAAAAVETELAAAGAAAGAAASATSTAAAEVTALSRLFTGIRGLLSFSRAQVAWTEFSLGSQAARRELEGCPLLSGLGWHDLAVTALSAGFGAGGAAATRLALAGRGGAALGTAVTGLGAGAAGAIPPTADGWRRTGSVPWGTFVDSTAVGATGSVAGEVGTAGLERLGEHWRHPLP